MSEPTFFIVGAPKCGTTALSEYLRTHPQVYMCSPKEPHYFATDFPKYRVADEWKDYLALFDGGGPAYRAIGEASPFYLYSSRAALEIRARIPTARLVVLLRNPMDLAVSMHAQALMSRDETVTEFSKAWALCELRRHGQHVSRSCREPLILDYKSVAMLGAQLERLLGVFPERQVRWWFLEDLRSDPRKVYTEVLEFIGVDDDGRESFPRINERQRARFAALAQFTQKTPSAFIRAAERLKRAVGMRRLGVLDALRRINHMPAAAPSLAPSLRREMAAYFEADVRRLQRVTGRNLSSWLELK